MIGVSSPQEIASHAIDQALLVGSSEVPEFDATIQTPLPVLYELIAVDVLGQPLLAAEEIDPAPIFGDEYPEDLLDVLAVDANRASFGLLPNEAQSLGTTDGARRRRLAPRLAEPAAPVDRRPRRIAHVGRRVPAGHARHVGVLLRRVRDRERHRRGGALSAMTTWAGQAPVEAQAIATPVSPTRVEVQACDPGTTTDQPVDAAGVTALVERQLAQLG